MPSKTKKATEPAQSSQEDLDVSMADAPLTIPEEQLPFLEEQRIRIVHFPFLSLESLRADLSFASYQDLQRQRLPLSS
jgi:hypothetical protein